MALSETGETVGKMAMYLGGLTMIVPHVIWLDANPDQKATLFAGQLTGALGMAAIIPYILLR